MSFAGLFEAEQNQIGQAQDPPAPLIDPPISPEQARKSRAGAPAGPVKIGPAVVTQDRNTGEPWVQSTPLDRVGLALSGGGIRSAVFNLGVLQALDQRGVLRMVDYLSTVSGGGYIGGFWTAWRKRGEPPPDGSVFPGRTSADLCEKGSADSREAAEIRHLREFSRYLIPRLGVDEPEMWVAVATILSGMLPALLVTLCTVGLAFYLWLGIGYLAEGNGWSAWSIPFLRWTVPAWHPARKNLCEAGVSLLVTLLLHLLRDVKWGHSEREEDAGGPGKGRCCYWSLAVLTSAASAWVIASLPAAWVQHAWGWRLSAPGQYWFDTFAFEPALGWLAMVPAVAVIWLFVEAVFRIIQALGKTAPGEIRQGRLRRGTLRDLLTARYLALGSCALGVALLWQAGFWFANHPSFLGGKASTSALGAFFSTLYILAHRWITKPDKQSKDGSVSGWLQFLKPWVPILAATAGLLSFLLFVVLLLHDAGLGPPGGGRDGWMLLPFPWGGADLAASWQGNLLPLHFPWALVAAMAGIFGLAWLLFDPACFGLHEFYRGRIARTFLGAARQGTAEENRQTVERPDDDFDLTELNPRLHGGLSPLSLRPVHLICCAANHLSGDALPTLSRGARSAVLSPYGISLGNDCCLPRRDAPPLTLSAAQTASAAAFNSQMGEKSIRLGPAAAFLMSALNLRLGLWVTNPAQVRQCRASTRAGAGRWRFPHALRWFPGRAFFAELLGHSNALPAHAARRLHLSDGGHFENLGLYELIRRHVRYILISDAGEDEDVVFDDLGNAMRRVREDFSVEIEIDLDALRPDANRISRQHLVTGTIHYNGFEGSDKGVLIYFKPSLTGDESGDIQQYRSRNRLFPHESTVDQFFSDAQWESYRRLGEHIGQVAFTFLDQMNATQRQAPESVFREVRRLWTALPPELQAARQEVAARLQEFEARLAREAPPQLRGELWPELGPPPPAGPPTHEDEAALLSLLAAGAGVMESAWRALQLDLTGRAPAHAGVMSRIRRWWSLPSVRAWWVPLSPLCGDDFREWIKLIFRITPREEVREADARGSGPRLRLRRHEAFAQIPQGLARDAFGASPRNGKANRFYTYELELGPAAKGRTLQAGMVSLSVDAATRRAHWDDADFVLPAYLSGAGLTTRFLEGLIEEMKKEAAAITILLKDPAPGQRDAGARQIRLDRQGLYGSRKFVVAFTKRQKVNGADAEETTLLRRLSP